MKVMDGGYLAQGYYRKQKAKIKLEVNKQETFTYDNYSWTEHISRKWGQWLANPRELLEQLERCGFGMEDSQLAAVADQPEGAMDPVSSIR